MLLDGILAVPEKNAGGKLIARGLNLLRRAITRAWDPLVQYDLDGRKMLLPLSHNLPLARKQCPDYSTNLGRIAAAIAAHYPEASAIDIGANIGDSVAIIKAQCSMPLLSIEADPKFQRIFELNSGALGSDVYLVSGFVASNTGPLPGAFQSADGTSRLAINDERSLIEAKSLPDILADFPRFRRANLLKIDTDGFDIPILRGALPFLNDVKPVLFFEYDPYYLTLNGEDGLKALQELRQVGYSTALVYDNFGDLMLTAELQDTATFEDLHAYFSGRKAQRFMDLCLFSEKDIEILNFLHIRERIYFTSRRL